LQPDGGWQMFTPVVPNGPHESEQQVWSQPIPLQTLPAGVQFAPPMVVQRPSVAPPVFTQLPPQHSKSSLQTSLVCAQNETFTHLPFAPHCFEQQSAFVVQALPSVAQPVPPARAMQFGPVPVAPHLPLQHWLSFVQACAGLSVRQAVAEH
jgi:hypothetical protein